LLYDCKSDAFLEQKRRNNGDNRLYLA
jgi:hypothetical protein